jgi:transketolase
MRDTFIDELAKIAGEDEDVMLLTGDLGFGVFEEFRELYPKQFLNVGVAEQNMTMVASGLALKGKKVFTYSIGNFPTLRCLEQIRNDVCYHDLNVTIVSIGGGFSYGSLGMSHHATEDLSIMRALPNMICVAPSSLDETRQATRALYQNSGPSYLRLDKSSADFKSKEKFKIGKAFRIKEGKDITIISSGGILEEVISASELLKKYSIDCRILSMHTVKPLDIKAVQEACLETGGIVTVEENNILGGLGGAVAEICLESSIKPSVFSRIGMKDEYSSVVGDQYFLRSHYGLDSLSITGHVKNLLSK